MVAIKDTAIKTTLLKTICTPITPLGNKKRPSEEEGTFTFICSIIAFYESLPIYSLFYLSIHPKRKHATHEQ
jgi:hypothetical protein